MIVCIAEKPSVGKDIARVLGATVKHDGYFEGHGYQVTWTFGHLCSLKEPHDYNENWKKWTMDSLPIIPPHFGIKLIDDPGIKKQFKIVERLFSKASEIINCGDAGQEGELIQRWVMQHAQVRCPVKRLWISSLTEEAIREGFKNLVDQSKYNNLYMAGLCRACGDWLLGMNATRLYTLKYGRQGQVLSIGRVQTPTLALIVQRDREISTFKSEPYWVLQTRFKDILFSSTKGKIKDKADGEQLLKNIVDKPFTVIDVVQKQGQEQPLQLYDLTALQVDCNKKYGMSADLTLKTIQSLYEKKLTTYPRVDTRYLSDDIYPKCSDILNNILFHSLDGFTQRKVEENLSFPLPKKKQVFDTSKVTDHHAIIPTGITPSGLSDYEKKVYDLIARRFVSVFLPACIFSTTTVLGRVGEIEFKVTGKQILSSGWRLVYNNTKYEEESEEKEKIEEKVLPTFIQNETGPHHPFLQNKFTQPPKPYTEATLLQSMETAGKFVEDEELKILMKENGIGRPSSRASIIETLFRRNYIKRNKRTIVSTIIGQQLINIIQDDMLKSCELTGQWEKKLRQIERGQYDPSKFITELKNRLQSIVINVKNDSSQKYIIGVNSTSLRQKKQIKKRSPKRD